ncbi:hypothetical protein CYMTET_29003 [Cymbomonas tetramitiformis]|uniref:Uncharacterized protein n=1 Tax=Cymbomonas tetramitiformis TaxID=36881 RepID=A0AAE0KVC6_9CHLO|nr:hypothetical protein CYMTET_29003 [Cymbomonas tetramitiformis]
MLAGVDPKPFTTEFIQHYTAAPRETVCELGAEAIWGAGFAIDLLARRMCPVYYKDLLVKYDETTDEGKKKRALELMMFTSEVDSFHQQQSEAGALLKKKEKGGCDSNTRGVYSLWGVPHPCYPCSTRSFSAAYMLSSYRGGEGTRHGLVMMGRAVCGTVAGAADRLIPLRTPPPDMAVAPLSPIRARRAGVSGPRQLAIGWGHTACPLRRRLRTVVDVGGAPVVLRLYYG